MYELISVSFPFANDSKKGKPRPGYIISPVFGKYNQVIVAYITTQTDEILDTDIIIDPHQPYFPSSGLLKKSLIKLHRLITLQPNAIKEGKGKLPDELIPELKQKLMKVFQLKISND